jgi:hypothetical protein
MAVSQYSDGKNYVCLSSDIVDNKLVGAMHIVGAKVYVADTGKTMIIKNDGTLGDYIQSVKVTNNGLIEGIATAGTSTSITDTTKDFEPATVVGKVISFEVDGINYYRFITTSSGNDIGFITIGDATGAYAVVGASPNGIATIRVNEAGSDGNAYTVSVVAGTGISQLESVVLEGNALTITSGTDGDGNPTDIMAGNLEGLFAGTVGVNSLFSVDDDFTVGAIDLTEEPIQFTGGAEAIEVPIGTYYYVF